MGYSWRGPELPMNPTVCFCTGIKGTPHTAGSAMADGQLDLRFVHDNLGHASLTTMSIYLHAEEDERHAQTERRHRLGW